MSYRCIFIIKITIVIIKSPFVCWHQRFADVSLQSWPPSLSASSSKGGDVHSADSSTWWHAIPSSQRMSCWRPSSPSMALYVAPVQPRTLCDWACSVVNVSIAPPQDVQTKLRDAYKRMGDEFMTNRIATWAKVCCTFKLKRQIVPRWELPFYIFGDFSAGIPPRRYPGSVLDEPRVD